MSEAQQTDTEFDVECPHCRKHFQARLLAPRSARHAGFKCPHCRLFVAFERGAEPEPPAAG